MKPAGLRFVLNTHFETIGFGLYLSSIDSEAEVLNVLFRMIEPYSSWVTSSHCSLTVWLPHMSQDLR